jgi:hypothetical protein
MINIIQPKIPVRYLPLKKAIKTKEKKFKLQGRYRFQKLPIAVENKAGSIRRSMPGEKPVWSNKMDYDYGFIVNTMASDGEGVDTYVDRSSNGMRENYHKGENDSEMIPTDVYVVHQLKIWHSKNWNNGICPDCHKHHTECSCPQHYDEDKVMLGFKSKDEAIKAYMGQYDSEMFLGPVSTYSIDEFHKVLKRSWGKKIPSKESEHEHWHGFDLDGTLAKDDGWKGKDYIGAPIEKTRERIQKLLSEGKKVKLFTARAADPKAIPPIQQWMKNNNIPLLEITNKKDPGMVSLEDDRAIQVRKNTGNLVKGIPMKKVIERQVSKKNTEWICPHCNKEILEKSMYYKDGKFYHRCDTSKEIVLPKQDNDINLDMGMKKSISSYYLDYDRISNELYRGEFMLPLFFSLQDFMVRAEVLFEDYGRTGESLDDFINRTVRKIKDKMFMESGQHIVNDSEFKMKYGVDTRCADTEMFDSVQKPYGKDLLILEEYYKSTNRKIDSLIKKSCGKDHNMDKSYLGQPGDQGGSHAMLRENLGESYGVKRKPILTMFGAMNEIEKCYPMEKNAGESLEDFTRRKLRSISGDHVQAMHDRGQSGELEKAFVKQTTVKTPSGKTVIRKAHYDKRGGKLLRVETVKNNNSLRTEDTKDDFTYPSHSMYEIKQADTVEGANGVYDIDINEFDQSAIENGLIEKGKRYFVTFEGNLSKNDIAASKKLHNMEGDRFSEWEKIGMTLSDAKHRARMLSDQIEKHKNLYGMVDKFPSRRSQVDSIEKQFMENYGISIGNKKLEKAFVKVPAHTRKGKRIPAYTYFTDKEKKVADVRHTKKTRVDYDKKDADKKIAELEKKKQHHDDHIEAAKQEKAKVEAHKAAGNSTYKVGDKEHKVDKVIKDLNDHIEHHTNEKKSHDNHIAKIKDRYKTEQAYWDKQRESRKAKEDEKKKAIDELVKDGKHGKEVLSDDVLAVLKKMKEEKPAEKKTEKKPSKEKTMDDYFKEYHAATSKDQKASIAKRAQDKFMKDNPDATLRDFLVASREYKDKMLENKEDIKPDAVPKEKEIKSKSPKKPYFIVSHGPDDSHHIETKIFDKLKDAKAYADNELPKGRSYKIERNQAESDFGKVNSTVIISKLKRDQEREEKERKRKEYLKKLKEMKSEAIKKNNRSEAMKGNKNAEKNLPVSPESEIPNKIVVPDDRRTDYTEVKTEGVPKEKTPEIDIPKPKKDWKPKVTEKGGNIHVDYSGEPHGEISIPNFRSDGFVKFTKKDLEMGDVPGPIQDAVNSFNKLKENLISNAENSVKKENERIKELNARPDNKYDRKERKYISPKIDAGYQIINGEAYLRVNKSSAKRYYYADEDVPQKIPMDREVFIVTPSGKIVKAGQKWRDEIKVQREIYTDVNKLSKEDQILMDSIFKASTGKMHEFFQRAKYDEQTNTINATLNTKKYIDDPAGIDVSASMTTPRFLHLLAHYNADRKSGYVVPEKNLPGDIQEQLNIFREDNRAYGERISSSYYEAYLKGVETSFGEKNAKDTLKSEYGVKIKRQNGKEMTDGEVEALKTVIDHTYNSMGNPSVLKKFAEERNLKISFSGDKNAFLRKAVGLYCPTESTVVVGPSMREVMPHEMTHFIDDVIGSKLGRDGDGKGYYASEMATSDIGMMTAQGRRTFIKDKRTNGKYWNRSCEVFARMVEQYAAKNDNNGDMYYGRPGYWSKEEFSKLEPKIVAVLKANLGKSFSDFFPVRIPRTLFIAVA